MRVLVERRDFFAVKQFDLRDSQNCFPTWHPFAGRCFAHMGFLLLLSLFWHRLINWKPRRSATRWTPCGTRRSLIVESLRKTCTAKHSGKCLEVSVLFISFPFEDRRISSHLWPFLWSSTPFTVFTPRLSYLVPFLFSLHWTVISLCPPHLSCPDNIPAP